MTAHKRVWLLLFGATFLQGLILASSVSIQHLRCEYLDNPLGIDAARPRLSWVLKSDQRGQKQTGYQIVAGPTRSILEKLGPDMLWDSGKTVSDETVGIQYGGKSLT